MHDSLFDLISDGDFADRDELRNAISYISICEVAEQSEKAAVGAATLSEQN
jgi:hypothetical protein